MTRGLVLPSTAQQRVTRMRWLAGEATFNELDTEIEARYDPNKRDIPGYYNITEATRCCSGYYLLKDHNGGKDPTAIDPFDRWSNDAPPLYARPDFTVPFLNRTADCIGGMVWCGMFDRYQPKRFSHLYDGWINTDSMLMDARGPKKCFRLLDRPEPGCFVVFASGDGGHSIGHIGGITDVPAEWDRTKVECWQALGVVDMAARTPKPGNARGNPLVWYHAQGSFVVSTMTH